MMGLNPETAIRLTNKGNKLVKSQCSIDLLIWVTDLSLYQLSFLKANGLIMKNIFSNLRCIPNNWMSKQYPHT